MLEAATRRAAFLATLVAVGLLVTACAATPAQQDEDNPCLVVRPAEPLICTMQYDPVCGCDGKTYSNACTARAAGVPRSSPGACDDPGPL